MINDMLNNKNLNLIVTEVFITGRNLKHYFAALKNIKLNSTLN